MIYKSRFSVGCYRRSDIITTSPSIICIAKVSGTTLLALDSQPILPHLFFSITMNSRANVTSRGGKRDVTGLPPRRSKADYAALQAAKFEMERHDRILEDRRRTDAKWRPKIPQVRRVTNFEAFKNRFHHLDEPDYAIEVLYASPNLQAQIRHEQTSRRKEDLARAREKWANHPYSLGGNEYGHEPLSSPRPKRTAGFDIAQNDKSFGANASELQAASMKRVRIQ